MAGHNKWSKVKRTKGVLDAKKGKLFTKLIKELTVSARMGGGNPEGNPRLRQAITAAREASMPKDNIERAIKKGTGELEGAQIEEVIYEGYGPAGVAVLVESATDNRNRTVADLRKIFKSSGGSLGEQGSVAWMFDRFGQLVFDKSKYSLDTVMEIALEAGASDITESEDSIDVLTEVTELYQVKDAFDAKSMEMLSVGFCYVPKNTAPVEEKEAAASVLELLDAIEDHDDVQHVHANYEIEDKLFAELSKDSVS